MTRDFTTDELAAGMEQLRLADALASKVEYYRLSLSCGNTDERMEARRAMFVAAKTYQESSTPPA